MRHHKKGRKFGRVRKVRKAFFRSLLRALIMKERILTTEARAKEIRPKVERLVTKAKRARLAEAPAKRGTLGARRDILRTLDALSAKKLISQLAGRYEKRAGGYTRIMKLGPRKSDAAKMAIIEFVK